MEPSGFELSDQVFEPSDLSLELGRVLGNVVGLVGVAGGDAFQVEPTTHLFGEGVFLVRAAPVVNLGAFDDGKHAVCTGFLEHTLIFLSVLILGPEASTVGVSGEHGAPGLVYHVLQEPGLVHPEDVVVKAEDEEVSFISINLDGGNDEEVHTLAEVDKFIVVPEEIVFGDGNAVQTGFFCLVNEVFGEKEAVIRIAGGVVMEVDEHWVELFGDSQ